MRFLIPKTQHLKPKIIFLAGPTAVGKSDLAISLAEKLNAEIISCDSMQVYKGMDIISCKPDKGMRRKIKHHLLDIISPEQEFSVAQYRAKAINAIKQARKKKKIPLFVGGSGLYMSVVVDGIFKQAGRDEKLRQVLYKRAKKFGSVYLHDKLKNVDENAAEKIHPNDTKRIIRALEVYKLTGKPISLLQKKRRGLWGKYDIRIFGLNIDRQELYDKINSRVEHMFAQGLVDEVRKLLKLRLSLTCAQAIGINEIKGFIEGKYTQEEAKELLKKNTRHYARRQLTWFRKDKRIVWLDIKAKNLLTKLGYD